MGENYCREQLQSHVSVWCSVVEKMNRECPIRYFRIGELTFRGGGGGVRKGERARHSPTVSTGQSLLTVPLSGVLQAQVTTAGRPSHSGFGSLFSSW